MRCSKRTFVLILYQTELCMYNTKTCVESMIKHQTFKIQQPDVLFYHLFTLIVGQKLFNK